MGRTKESGYTSQLYILLILREFGQLYGQEIVDRTGLHREVVWRNLLVLFRKGIIKKKRVGRRVYYSPNVDTQTLEYTIMILNEGGLRKILEKSRRFFKKMKRRFNQMISAAKRAEELEDELIELAYAEGMEPYFENLPHAETWKETREEIERLGLKETFHLPESMKTVIMKSVLHPKRPITKDVKLSSGSCFTIKKMTALELLDIVRKITKEAAHERDVDPYLIEAVKRLSS